MMKLGMIFLAALVGGFASSVAPASAQYGEGGAALSSVDDAARVRLLPGWQRDDGLYVAAIEIELAPGWKTYWRAPGTNGIPPAFDWSRSSNLSQVGYFWPAPTVFDTYGSRTIGYEDRLVLPVLMRPADPSQPIAADLSLDYGVCSDICVPAHSRATGVLDVAETPFRADIEAAIARRPVSGATAGVTSTRCRLRPGEGGHALQADLDFSRAAPDPLAVVIESDNADFWISETDHQRFGTAITAEADVQHYGSGPMMLDRSGLRITVIASGQSIEVRGCAG